MQGWNNRIFGSDIGDSKTIHCPINSIQLYIAVCLLPRATAAARDRGDVSWRKLIPEGQQFEAASCQLHQQLLLV